MIEMAELEDEGLCEHMRYDTFRLTPKGMLVCQAEGIVAGRASARQRLNDHFMTGEPR